MSLIYNKHTLKCVFLRWLQISVWRILHLYLGLSRKHLEHLELFLPKPLKCWLIIIFPRLLLGSWCNVMTNNNIVFLMSVWAGHWPCDAHAVLWVGTQDTSDDECGTKWALSTRMVLKHQEVLFTAWITASSHGGRQADWEEHIASIISCRNVRPQNHLILIWYVARAAYVCLLIIILYLMRAGSPKHLGP